MAADVKALPVSGSAEPSGLPDAAGAASLPPAGNGRVTSVVIDRLI